MHSRLLPVALLALLALRPLTPHAEPSPEGETTIDAQRLEIYLDRKMHAIGDAELHRNGEAIFGDRIDYDMIDQELHAVGNTRVEHGGNVITGPELRLKLEQREGEMKEPIFTLRGMPAQAGAPPGTALPEISRGSAKLMTFDGPDRETLKQARYTTCAPGVDDWYLRANELQLDHYTEIATAKHASIEFQGVPILYTPWIDFPFKKQRKSGFLTPTWATTSRSGFDVALPYYWNIAPDRDATLTPRWMGNRGMQMQGEFRYLDEDYAGQDILEFLPNDQVNNQNRFYTNLKHSHTFGNGWSGTLNFERVSDAKYFADMSTQILNTSRVNLPQEVALNYSGTHGGATWNFNGVAQQYQTLDTSYPYQRLPQLTLTGSQSWELALGNLYTQWVRFDVNDKATTTLTGNRLTAYPSFTLPLAQPYGYVTPKFGIHYTRYDLDANPGTYQSDSRIVPIFSMDSGLFFDRDLRVVRNQYTQTLEPRMFYVYIPHRKQSQLPVFDSGGSTLNMGTLFTENEFSGNDRVNDANQVSLALTSRLIDASGVQRLAATLGQRFYFNDQKVVLPGGTPRTRNSTDLLAEVTARLLNHWDVDLGWQYNTDVKETQRANIGARYTPETGKTLNLSYRYTANSDFTTASVNQIDFSSQWPLTSRWYGLGRINYSFLSGVDQGLIEALAGAEYDAGCWQARAVMQRVATATATANYALFFQLELGSIASVGTSPLALLRRSISGYTSSALIPN